MLDQRQNNILKAVALAVISIIPLSYAADFVTTDIRNEFRESCSQEDVTCSAPHFSTIYTLFGLPTIVVFLLSFQYFEKKRFKTWSSYR